MSGAGGSAAETQAAERRFADPKPNVEHVGQRSIAENKDSRNADHLVKERSG